MTETRRRQLRDSGVGEDLLWEWHRRDIDPTEADLLRLKKAVDACAKEGISRKEVEAGEIYALRGLPPLEAYERIELAYDYRRQRPYFAPSTVNCDQPDRPKGWYGEFGFLFVIGIFLLGIVLTGILISSSK